MELLIKHARIVDGTGAPWFRGCIGIRDDKIAHVGEIVPNGATVIDAQDQIVSPGFIDMHGHSDYLILGNPTADSKVLQGITTEVAGTCGYSCAPIGENFFHEWWVEDIRKRFTVTDKATGVEMLNRHGICLSWTQLSQYLDTLDTTKPSLNYLTFMGHVALRVGVTGQFEKKPSEAELLEMRQILRDGMRAGALGFSTESGTHRKMELPDEELLHFFAETASLGGRVAYHIKDYGDKALEELEHSLDLVSRAGVKTILSHLNVNGRENWGKAVYMMECVEKARMSGCEIWADVMPCPGGGEALFYTPRATDLLPQWVAQMEPDEIRNTLKDPAKREQIRLQLKEGQASDFYYVPGTGETEAYGRGPLADAHWPYYVRIQRSDVPGVEGRTVRQIADRTGESPLDTLFRIIQQDPYTYKFISKESQEDRDVFICHPLTGFGTDGGLVNAIRRPGIANPTLYSVFPYVLKEYVREKQMIPLEEAIRKMTSLGMAAHGIRDRGILARGYHADIVVFDPDTIGPRIDYERPMPMPPCTGIDTVIVNGEVTVREGAHLGTRAGRVLRHACSS